MASLAPLLTLGLTIMLACNLLVLPALLTWSDSVRNRSGADPPASGR